MVKRIILALTIGLLALSLSACPNGGTKPQTGSFSLAATDANIRINAINPNALNPEAKSIITIDRKNNFDKAIQLTAENLPKGIKATFIPNNTKDDKSNLMLELTGNPEAKTYTVTVKGTAGNVHATTTFSLTVTKKPLSNSFTLTVADIDVTQDPSKKVELKSKIIIKRNNFDKEISFSVESKLKDVYAEISPRSTNTNTADLRIDVYQRAKAGRHTITIIGKSGAETVRTSFELTINPYKGPPVITSMTPGNKASAVPRNVVVYISFSTEMDRPATERAFSSDFGPVTISWANVIAGNDPIMQVAPKNLLKAGKTYHFSISTDAKDKSGKHLEAKQEAEFSTVKPVAPKVVDSKPAQGAKNVEIDSQIWVIFSKEMDLRSLKDAFSSNMGKVAISWIQDRKMMLIKPDNNLKFDMTYKISISTLAKDMDGNHLTEKKDIQFTTKPSLPVVTRTFPTNGAVGVSKDVVIKVYFSKMMDMASVEKAFNSGPNLGPVTFFWIFQFGGGHVLEITPRKKLLADTNYFFNIANTAKDADGNPFVEAKSVGFTTKASAPIVTSTFPVNVANGVEKDVKIEVHFSKPMDKVSTESAFSSSFSPVQFKWAGNIMIVTPVGGLKYGDIYDFHISTDAKDEAGNNLVAATDVTFSTLRVRTVKIPVEKALDGWIVEKDGSIHYGDDLVIGDFDDNSYSAAFLSFDTSLLPTNVDRILTAKLKLFAWKVINSPFEDLVGIVIGHVYYGDRLDSDDYNKYLSSDSSPFNREKDSANIIAMLKDDIEHRAQRDYRSQYKVNFAQYTDYDFQKDKVHFYSGDYESDIDERPFLEVTYLEP